MNQNKNNMMTDRINRIFKQESRKKLEVYLKWMLACIGMFICFYLYFRKEAHYGMRGYYKGTYSAFSQDNNFHRVFFISALVVFILIFLYDLFRIGKNITGHIYDKLNRKLVLYNLTYEEMCMDILPQYIYNNIMVGNQYLIGRREEPVFFKQSEEPVLFKKSEIVFVYCQTREDYHFGKKSTYMYQISVYNKYKELIVSNIYNKAEAKEIMKVLKVMMPYAVVVFDEPQYMQRWKENSDKMIEEAEGLLH